jgi:periplasmic copper chaperone A
MGRTLRAALIVVGVTLVGVFGFAALASAHVTVSSSDATQGGEGKVTFRVPNESDTASTIKVQVVLPAQQPIASVLVLPVPGFTSAVSTTKLAKPITNDDGDQVSEVVSQITWTADSPATAIKPGEFAEFSVSMGPLPKAASMTFKALQTYSDGTIVRWIDVTQPGQPEPEHPAPVLALAAAPATTTSGGSNGAALAVGIIGLVLGLIGAGLGGLAFARTRGVSR